MYAQDYRDEAPMPPPTPEDKLPGDWFYFKRGIGDVMWTVGMVSFYGASVIAWLWAVCWLAVLPFWYFDQPERLPALFQWWHGVAITYSLGSLLYYGYGQAVAAGRKRQL